jgi:hydrogenase expression/formation protein HypC
MCLAVPGKVIEVIGDDPVFRTGRVSFVGIIKQVSLACVPDAAVDDYVLVHVGMALSKVDEEEPWRFTPTWTRSASWRNSIQKVLNNWIQILPRHEVRR